jgi:hypothetical protein
MWCNRGCNTSHQGCPFIFPGGNQEPDQGEQEGEAVGDLLGGQAFLGGHAGQFEAVHGGQARRSAWV